VNDWRFGFGILFSADSDESGHHSDPVGQLTSEATLCVTYKGSILATPNLHRTTPQPKMELNYEK
jgi:hypothetical protein